MQTFKQLTTLVTKQYQGQFFKDNQGRCHPRAWCPLLCLEQLARSFLSTAPPPPPGLANHGNNGAPEGRSREEKHHNPTTGCFCKATSKAKGEREGKEGLLRLAIDFCQHLWYPLPVILHTQQLRGSFSPPPLSLSLPHQAEPHELLIVCSSHAYKRTT